MASKYHCFDCASAATAAGAPIVPTIEAAITATAHSGPRPKPYDPNRFRTWFIPAVIPTSEPSAVPSR